MERNDTVQMALEELGTPVTSYLRRYCGDDQLAQDLAQETLIRVARSLPEFNGRSSLKTWAFSIANRVASDHYRRSTRSLSEVRFDDDMEYVDDVPERKQEFLAAVQKVVESLEEYWPLSVRQIHYNLLNDPPLKLTPKKSQKDPEHYRYCNDRGRC